MALLIPGALPQAGMERALGASNSFLAQKARSRKPAHAFFSLIGDHLGNPCNPWLFEIYSE